MNTENKICSTISEAEMQELSKPVPANIGLRARNYLKPGETNYDFDYETAETLRAYYVELFDSSWCGISQWFQQNDINFKLFRIVEYFEQQVKDCAKIMTYIPDPLAPKPGAHVIRNYAKSQLANFTPIKNSALTDAKERGCLLSAYAGTYNDMMNAMSGF